MFLDDGDDPFDSPGDSLSDDGQSEEMEEEEEEEKEEEEEDAEESRSQVTFDTSMTGADFLTPGGLNAFTIALPAKSERLYLKDLPKPIKVSGISKKNVRASINELNSNVRSLVKTVINENSTARSLRDSADLAIKCGTKSLDAAARKVQILENELLVKNKKLTDVSEKLRQAAFDRDASILREEMTSTTLKTTQKELADVKKETRGSQG